MFIKFYCKARPTKTAVIVTTFNWPAALDQVLSSLASQTYSPDVIVITDDGSDQRTAEIIRVWSGKLHLKHAWQPDSGFRASRARNLGVAKILCADEYYVVMIDGDCVLPSNFIEMHTRLQRRGWMLAGGRVLVGASDTTDLLRSGVTLNSLRFCEFKFRYLSLGFIRRLRSRNWKIVRTCNVSLWLDDFLKVGGFDEAFVGWGREDSDLVVRLIRSGIRIINGRFAASVKHLYHNEVDRSRSVSNLDAFQKLQGSQSRVLPTKSIFKYFES